MLATKPNSLSSIPRPYGIERTNRFLQIEQRDSHGFKKEKENIELSIISHKLSIISHIKLTYINL